MKFDCFISPSTRFLDIEVDITVVFLVSGTNVTGDVPIISYWPKRHLHDRVILLLLLPKSFSFFLSYLNLVIPARFKTTKPSFAQESKPLKYSGISSCSNKMTSSCKWPTVFPCPL